MSSRRLSLVLVPWLYRAAFTLILWTCRVRFVGREPVTELEKQGCTWIFSSWHENTGAAVALERNRRMAMMASDSRDGEYIARGIEAFGNIPVRGSKSSGGAKAAKAMTRWLKSGHSAAVTPDGPRGPRRELQPGVLWIGALSGAPLVPYHVTASRQWVLKKTWDKHRIPKPFSKVFVAVGPPYFVDRARLKDDEAGVIAEFEQRMNRNAEYGDGLV
jgi:hypothetical protein